MAVSDREALLALYHSTNGAGWKNSTNWNTHADISLWHGVKVNNQGSVVELSLTYNNLQGIPRKNP